MKNNKSFILKILSLTALIVFLFVSAPPPLPVESEHAGARIPIESVFAMVEAENDIVRSLWTKEIVRSGKKVGLEFDEDWREPDVEAGPLPALFLRTTAKNLETDALRLSLYLGSDFPISSANRFEGIQAQKFRRLKASREPQFFFSNDTGLYTAMFADIAISKACVGCHNDHPDTPKSDWKLDDVMGATTWMYPKQWVTTDECIKILALLRRSFRAAYSAYIDKVKTFQNSPELGEKWPRDGFFLPTVEEFITEAARQASVTTLQAMMGLHAPKNQEGEKLPAKEDSSRK